MNARTALAALVLLFAIAFSFAVASFPTIPDADSYFHLAVAREYAEHGFVKGLRWARLSVMHEHFGDKELLFHAELIPFVLFARSDAGGRVALVLWNVIIFALLGAFGLRLAGTTGLLVPLIVYLATPGFVLRITRLRPELGAIALVIAFLWAATRRRPIAAGIIAAVFALSYTAWQLLPGLAILIGIASLVWDRLSSRSSGGQAGKPVLHEARLAIATCVGTLAGIVVHPHFPDNARIWFLQNVDFFRMSAKLDTGREIGPPSARFLLVDNLGWWIVIATIALLAFRNSRRRAESADATPRPDLIALIVATIAFALLQILFERMSLYFFPVATLLAVAALARVHLDRSRRVSLAIALAVGIVASSPATLTILARSAKDPGPLYPWRTDLTAFGRAVPRGARIAAPWGPSEFYVFFAPQGEYLNVLDPLFLFAAHPVEYRVQRGVFRGTEPDVPLAVATALESDYLAFDRLDRTPLVDRVAGDPRLRALYNGYNYLGAVQPAPGAFVLDWHTPGGLPYPRSADARGRAVEGYVDARRFGPNAPKCVTLVHDEGVDQPKTLRFLFAPYGIARLSIDGSPRAASTSPSGAVLAQSATVTASLTPGVHHITVETCRDDRFGHNGFYLVRR